MAKQYGLIDPKAKKPKPPTALSSSGLFRKKNVFDEESDGDEEEDSGPGKPMDHFKASMEARLKRQTKMELKKALEEDATVFQYDEVYDDLQEKKAETVAARKKEGAEKKPKYIQNLLKQAEVRNRENERRIERKVQKEREAEGDEFKDKEVFVTTAYRKKMEEMQKLEEEEEQRDRLEAALDVTKQRDMSGFYRHLYRQTMGEEKGQKEEDDAEEEKADNPKTPEEEAKKSVEKVAAKKAKDRSYRRTTMTEHEEDDSESSDSSASSSDSEAGKENAEDIEEVAVKSRDEKNKERKMHMKLEKEKRERRKRKIERGEESSDDEAGPVHKEKKNYTDETEVASQAARLKEREEKREIRRQAKKELWKKKTVDKTFEEAVQRYFERKSQRRVFPWTL